MPRSTLAVLLLLAATVLASCSEENDLGLKVKKSTKMVTAPGGSVTQQGMTVQNVGGAGKIEIKDITINDREDCTRISDTAELYFKDEARRFSGDLHRLWFIMQVVPTLTTDLNPNAKIALDVGDEGFWSSQCQITRATIKTDRGTETYEWK
jgi:hypothetical protein